MVQGPVARPDEMERQESECRHHWIIESPQGATSWGECKICGTRREFPNSAGDALWERDPVPGGSRWGGVGPGSGRTVVYDSDDEASLSSAPLREAGPERLAF